MRYYAVFELDLESLVLDSERPRVPLESFEVTGDTDVFDLEEEDPIVLEIVVL